MIIGKLIPAATGLKAYRNVEVASTRQRDLLFGFAGEGDEFESQLLGSEQGWPRLLGGVRHEEDDIPIDDLDLPTYIHSVLSRAEIETVRELTARTPTELLAVPGFGQKSLEAVSYTHLGCRPRPPGPTPRRNTPSVPVPRPS